jgi:hypothetical protein
MSRKIIAPAGSVPWQPSRVLFYHYTSGAFYYNPFANIGYTKNRILHV